MKINRLVKVKNHRIFRDFSWPTDLPDFSRFNLIYGWNGAGKTTLSNLFRHLQNKDPVIEGELQFKIDARLVSQNEFLNAELPKIRVFNRDTVKRSIFEVAHENLPPVYYLGEDSAIKQTLVENLRTEYTQKSTTKAIAEQEKTSAVRSFDSFCTDQAKAIKNLLTAANGEFNNYNTNHFKQTAEKLRAEPEIERLSEAEVAEHLIIKASTPKEKLVVPQALYPDFSNLVSRVSAALNRTVVAQTIEALEENPDLASWVKQGLTIHSNEHQNGYCQFCTQNIPYGRIEDLEGHFNQAFENLQLEISALTIEIASAISFVKGLTVPDKGLIHEHLSVEYESTKNTLSQQSWGTQRFLESCRDALSAKASRPFQSINLMPFFIGGNADSEESKGLLKFFEIVTAASASIGTLSGKQAFDRLCGIIEKHNQHCDSFQIAQIQSRRLLEREEVAQVLDDYLLQNRKIADLDFQVETLSKLLLETQGKINQLEIEIREHFRAADELNQDIASYLGRDELKFVPNHSGYSITRNGETALHLSEGERTAVSFIYFLKSLEDNSFDLENGIVVIDDPVSSLDENALYCAFGFMKSRIQNAKQIFVLTHNFTFFRQVKNWFDYINKTRNSPIASEQYKKSVGFYMLKNKITEQGRSAYLCQLDDLLRKYESEYHYLFKLVLQASQDNDDQPMAHYYPLPNISRRLLEAVLAFKQPGKTGELFQQIKDIAFDETKKTRILRFTNTYSHHGLMAEPAHDLSILAETPDVMRDVLALVEHLDQLHFESMKQLCVAE